MKKMMMLVLVLCFLLSSTAMATKLYYGYRPMDGNLWSNSNNWTSDLPNPHDPPVLGDEALIWDGKHSVVDYAAPEFLLYRGRSGSVVDITASGVLTADTIVVGENGTVSAEINVNGGSLVSTRTSTSSPAIRLGTAAGASGILTVADGSVSALGIQVGAGGPTSSGKVNLYGGTMNLTFNSNAALYLYSYGTMEMKDSGTLVIAGDRRDLLEGWTDEHDVYTPGYIANGYLYTSQTGKSLDVFYDTGLDQTIVTVVPEPATLIMLGLGSILLVKRKSNT